jgi:hypothetical protein
MTTFSNPGTDGDARSPGAQRMARYRKRRRDGIRCYTVLVRDREVEILIRLGLLTAAERNNPNSVVKALHRLFDETLGQVR